jgi:hypothetical protein
MRRVLPLTPEEGWGEGSPTARLCSAIPILWPETGMHTTPGTRIDVDREERFRVSGSDDSTVRIRKLASGRLLRTLWVPVNQTTHDACR